MPANPLEPGKQTLSEKQAVHHCTTEGILGSYERKASVSCLISAKVSQILLRHCSSQCCNQLLDMSWHATFTFHYRKAHQTETCVLVSTNTWAFRKHSWSYSAKSTSQPTQLLNLAGIIINYSSYEHSWLWLASCFTDGTVIPSDKILAWNERHLK